MMSKTRGPDFIGKVVKEVRHMTDQEMNTEGWEPRHGTPPIVIVFDCGTKLYPSCDDEGNGPGTLFGISSDGMGIGLF